MKTNIAVVVVFAFAVTTTSNASAASPFRKLSNDRLLHVPSNVTFPVKVGLFQRTGTHVFDKTGRDVSVRYLLDSFVLVDVYSYPVGPAHPDLNTEFKIQQNAIRQLNHNVKLVSRQSASINQRGRAISGIHGDYDLRRNLFEERNRRCGSQMYVFRDGQWLVAYRIDYPLEKSTIALKHVANFMAQWTWKEQ